MKAYNEWFDVVFDDNAERLPCQARGRVRRVRPVIAGDFVQAARRADDEGWIEAVRPRRNELARPPVANVDRVVAVQAWRRPDFSPDLLDRILLQTELVAWRAEQDEAAAAPTGAATEPPPNEGDALSRSLQAVVVVNKVDLATGDERAELEASSRRWTAAGYSVYLTSAITGEGVAELRGELDTGLTVFAGPSGAGKSRLLSALAPGLALKSGTVSEQTGRGRHTTRHAELLPLGRGWVADTPGFSRMDSPQVAPAELELLFPEFEPYLGGCRFHDCRHHSEPDCAVRAALARGHLDERRYAFYVRMLEEAEAAARPY